MASYHFIIPSHIRHNNTGNICRIIYQDTDVKKRLKFRPIQNRKKTQFIDFRGPKTILYYNSVSRVLFAVQYLYNMCNQSLYVRSRSFGWYIILIIYIYTQLCTITYNVCVCVCVHGNCITASEFKTYTDIWQSYKRCRRIAFAKRPSRGRTATTAAASLPSQRLYGQSEATTDEFLRGRCQGIRAAAAVQVGQNA